MDRRAWVEWLTIAGYVEVWKSIGLAGREDPDGSFLIPLVGPSLRIVTPGDGPLGLIGWALSGEDVSLAGSIDGLPTEVVEPLEPAVVHHDVGAERLDHVVVVTDALRRTSRAIEMATGCELKRVRKAGKIRQGFHRIGCGGLIVEVVNHPNVTDRRASFWGFVVNVKNLDAACNLLGEDSINLPKDAVQPGRRIATVRKSLNLGSPVAFMTP